MENKRSVAQKYVFVLQCGGLKIIYTHSNQFRFIYFYTKVHLSVTQYSTEVLYTIGTYASKILKVVMELEGFYCDTRGIYLGLRRAEQMEL